MECGVGWRARGRTAMKQRGRSEQRRPVVPRGVLIGAWPPRGVRALAPVGRGRGERARRGAEAGRARPGWLVDWAGKRGVRPTKVKR